MDWRMRFRNASACVLWLAWVTVVLAGCGPRGESPSREPSAAGQASSDTSPHAADDRDQLSPEETLRRMIAAYRSAASYRDKGVFRAVLYRDLEELPDSAPLSVAWARPNRIAIRAYQATVVSDGKSLQAKIVDADSRDLDGQVVIRSTPEQLTLGDLFSDVVLRESLGGRLGLHPMQLELLLAEEPLEAFLAASATRKFLTPQAFDGRSCLRVEVDLDGRYVFWIDREEYLLRRFEYPAEALLTDEEKDVDLSIVAEFHGARFGEEIPAEQFTLAAHGLSVPADAKRVQFFVVPPQPLPTEMFGKRPQGYEFPALDGGELTPESLAGKIAVLAWFSNHSGSRACLESLDEVRRMLPEDAPVALYGVCTEPSSISNDELRALLAPWNISTPIVRDLGAYGRDLFDIRVAPSLVVLDARGAVQVHESGANPQLAALVKDQLHTLVQRLVAGEDFAAAILTQAQAEQEAYQNHLRAAAEGRRLVPDLQPAAIAPKSEPKHLKLSPRWTNNELTQPGNVLVVEDNGGTKLVALDGWRTVVELDEQGQVQRRVELELPESAAVSYLRTAVNDQGRRYYAAFSLLSPQAHVFDADWKHVLSYPPEDEKHEGIRDALLAHLDDSGSPTLAVGFWGVVGLHGVDLSGKRQWSNRDVTPVLSLAATTKDVVGWRKLLATGEAGQILRLNQYGHADPAMVVPGRAIHQIVASDWPTNRPTAYLGLSYAPDQGLLTVGLDHEFQEVWSYRLPPGAFANQIQFATVCRWSDASGGQWLLAGPDGSVHLISDDGEFFDFFQTGQQLNGLAGARLGGEDMLILSTESGITALHAARPSP